MVQDVHAAQPNLFCPHISVLVSTLHFLLQVLERPGGAGEAGRRYSGCSFRLFSVSTTCNRSTNKNFIPNHRYWNDPEVLKKLGSAMGDSVMPANLAGAGGVPPGWPAGENGAADGEAEGEEEEEDEEHNVHSAASTGRFPFSLAAPPQSAWRCAAGARWRQICGSRNQHLKQLLTTLHHPPP